MKKIFVLCFALLTGLVMQAQTQAISPQSSVKCLGVELDGSQTLRVQGYGRNKSDAKEQAKKNAVWAVIFDGIKDGADGCNMRPLVFEVNAKERYEDYFNKFFADNGAYTEYVSNADTKRNSIDKQKDKVGYLCNITVRVLRAPLKAKLKDDGIIKE